jgi:hypothetical protein
VTDQAIRQWLDWAAWAVGPDPSKQRRAAEAALAAEAAGLSFPEACELAREAAGIPRLGPQAVASSPVEVDVGPVAEMTEGQPQVSPAKVRLKARRPAPRPKPVIPQPTIPRPPVAVPRSVQRTVVWLALGGLVGLVALTAYVEVSPPTCLTEPGRLRQTFIQTHDAAVAPGNRAIATLNACDAVSCVQTPSMQLARTFDDFNNGLRPLCFPAAEQADAAALMKANADVSSTARALAAATSLAEVTTTLDELGQRLRSAEAASRTLEDDLGINSG